LGDLEVTDPGYDSTLINPQPDAKIPRPINPYHLSQEEEGIMDEWTGGMLVNWMTYRGKCPTCLLRK